MLEVWMSPHFAFEKQRNLIEGGGRLFLRQRVSGRNAASAEFGPVAK